MKILIAGGGIGGLSLALSLADAGLDDVEILEAAPAIRELGVGINVLPHAARELTELGLLDALSDEAIPTAELVYYTKRGQRIWGEPRGTGAGYAWPQFSIHRGALLGILFRAVVERLGEHRIQTGSAVTGFGQSAGGKVWVDVGSEGRRIEGDLLVACDGVHSLVRSTLYPDEGAPKWNGVTMWRGITLQQPFLTGRTMIMAGSFARRVVAYPISRREEARGRSLVNWVAEVKTAADQAMPRQDWEFRASADEPLAHFGSFRFDFLDVPALIRGAEVIYRYPMVDRDPLPTWDFGRVTLLGDAAHPMYPVGSNGASQAIIDARVLARELALASDVETAVRVYDAQRRPATAAVVLANRGVGPEKCMEIVEARAPNGFVTLGEVISPDELAEISSSYKRTAGFDPATLNARPSLTVR